MFTEISFMGIIILEFVSVVNSFSDDRGRIDLCIQDFDILNWFDFRMRFLLDRRLLLIP